ncbi:TRAP transporter small permease [Roseibium sp. M-1]
MSEQAEPADGWIADLLEYATTAALLAMMILTFFDVLGRYLFNAPIFGAAEMIQFLLAATVFSGLGLVSQRDAHIAVELLSPRLRAWFPRTQPIIVGLVSAAGLFLMGFELGKTGIEAWQSGKATIVLEWPMYTITLLCAGLCLLAAALQLVAPWRHAS